MNLAAATKEELLTLIQEQSSRIEKQDSELKARSKKILTLELLNQKLEEELKWERHQRFGASSERHTNSDQLAFLINAPETPPSKDTSVKDYEAKTRAKKTKTSGKPRYSKNIKVEEKIELPKEVEGLSEDEYEIIDRKVVSEKLVYVPATFVLERTIRPTVKLKDKLYRAPAPDSLIEGSFADVTFLAALVSEKCFYHMPLYRQHQRITRAGVDISRTHLTRLFHRTAELLDPVYLCILSEILTSELIAADETPLKASRKEKGKMKTGYYWVFFAGGQVAFKYSDSRSHRVLEESIGSECRVLLSDAYSAYECYAKEVESLESANCWAHVRRKFYEADSKFEVELIQKLFMLEREEGDILEIRQKQSAILVEDFFNHLHKKKYEEQVPLDNKYGAALNYALGIEEGLKVFLKHPNVALSNNVVENEIRPVALGRKNWMFFWTELGARYGAIAYTLVQNCRLNGIDPWKYLADVLSRLSTHPASRVHELTPRNWKRLFAESQDAA